MTGPLALVSRAPLASSLLPALCGALVGLGVWVIVAGVRDWLPDSLTSTANGPGAWLERRFPTRLHQQALAAGLGAGLLLAAVSGMPAVAVLVAGAVVVGADLGSAAPMREAIAQGAAIATWAETVRHELQSGQPQRAALIAACDRPPPGLETALARLGRRMEVEQVPDALWAFAAEVRHPTAGAIVAALDAGYRYGAGDLGSLMAGQVDSTRHQVQMLRETHAARAKHRRTMLLLLALFTVVVAGLFLAWPHFLSAYRTGQGQLVLTGIGAGVLAAVRSLGKLSQVAPPPDFFTAPADPDQGADVPPRGDRYPVMEQR